VREAGLALGIPKDRIYRQPFPGPGLAVRCLGEVTRPRLDLLRQADHIVCEEIEAAHLDIWQYFAVLTGVRSVGLVDEKRVYGECIAVRAVHSVKTVTAEWIRLPYDVLERISARIVGEVDGVCRVVYDITDKPPGTIEWE